MYRMIIVTALGNYAVEMVPGKEEPTADELDTYRRLKRGAWCIRDR